MARPSQARQPQARPRVAARIAAAAATLLGAGCAAPPPEGAPRAVAAPLAAMQRVQHLVVIYAENHSFDNLYGLFPGAEGIAQATPAQKTQLDHDGKPLPWLQVFKSDGAPDPAYDKLPNGPFRIDAPPLNKRLDEIVPSPIHVFWHNQEQINGGANNMFAAMSNVGGWVMGHYDTSSLKLWQWAKEYTLADHFFMGAFGGSYLNHQYLICACAPWHADAPDSMRVKLDAQGKLLKVNPGQPQSAAVAAVKVVSRGGGQVSPDGWSVNTSQPTYQPSGIAPAPGGPLDLADPKGNAAYGLPVPPQTAPTIGDRLSDRGVSWAWYSGGWDAAGADGRQDPAVKRTAIYAGGRTGLNFQAHHQPFNYYLRYAPGMAERAMHLKDGSTLMKDIAAGTLPAVSFYKPVGRDSQHPSYADLKTGDEHIHAVLTALRNSPQWKDMLVVVTYDENGGWWDHVPPPTGSGASDWLGPGTRIPALLIGPNVKRGHVEKTVYDTSSILKFITQRWGLQPLAGIREKTGNLAEVLQ